MLKRAIFSTVWICSLLLAVSSPARAGEVRLSVAASMTDAVKELAARYGQRHPGVKLLPNFGSSGALAKQIQQGAPSDIFISANPQWIDLLLEQQMLRADSVRSLAGNALVLVGARELTVQGLDDLLQLKRIALGSPKSVPAGQYAEQALQQAGLYQQLAGRLVMAQDVRQALVYADRGEVDAAFVYRTDALLAKKAVILYTVDGSRHDPILYPAGLTTAGGNNPEAVAFFAFLGSDEARQVLEKYGFVVN